MNGESFSADWLAPWFTIWISPRATIRRIVDADPEKFVLGIAWVAGALAALDMEVSSQQMPGGAAFATDWISSLGPFGLAAFAFGLGVFGVAMLYILGGLYRWSGGVLGGTARTIEVRSALAWAQVPAIYVTILGVIAAIAAPAAPIQPGQLPSFSLWSLARMALGAWALVIPLKTLGEVHRFSAWRSFSAMMLGDLVIGAAAVAIVIAVFIGRHMV
jgi:hypothetical protein